MKGLAKYEICKKKDVIIIAIILLFSIFFYTFYQLIYKNTKLFAHIYYENELLKIVDLSTCKTECFSFNENKNVVFKTYSDGSIEFFSSDCPDKICVNSGRLSTVGESAACLPNKFFIKIVTNGNEEIDVIV